VRLRLLVAVLSTAALLAQEASRDQLEKEVEAYRRLLLDWAGLTRYGSDNAELKPAPGRVVFLGDEITENWGAGGTPFFPGKPYLNRGITRQTTAQMLVRFRQDVISVKPAAVVIQAGIHDIGSVMGPAPPWQDHRRERMAEELRPADGRRLPRLLLRTGRGPRDEAGADRRRDGSKRSRIRENGASGGTGDQGRTG